MKIFTQIFNYLRDFLMSNQLKDAVDRNASASHELDRAVREVLGK